MIKFIFLIVFFLLNFNSVFANSFTPQMPLVNRPACLDTECPIIFKHNGNSAAIFCKIDNANLEPLPSYGCKFAITNAEGQHLITGYDYGINASLKGYWLPNDIFMLKIEEHDDTVSYVTGGYIFLDFKHMLVSPGYSRVYTVDFSKGILLSDTWVNQWYLPENTIYVSDIFSGKMIMKIQRNFAGIYAYRIYPEPKTHFLENGNLSLVYDTPSQKAITEIIPIDYSKLGIANS